MIWFLYHAECYSAESNMFSLQFQEEIYEEFNFGRSWVVIKTLRGRGAEYIQTG